VHIFDAAWALLLLPIAGVGASYLAETRRGAALAVAVCAWLTVLAALIVLGATVHTLPQIHQSTLAFWTFPVTQTPFNSAATTLLATNFQVGVGYSANAAAVVLVSVTALAVALAQTQMTIQLRSDPRLPGLMRLTGVLNFGAVLLIMAPGLFQTLLGFELCGLAAALAIGSGRAEDVGRVARQVYLIWRAGALALLLAVIFLYVKFSGAVAVAATDVHRKGPAISPYGLNLGSLASMFRLAARGQVHGVGARSLTLAAVLFLVAAASASGTIPLHRLWRGFSHAPGATVAVLASAVGVAAGAALLVQGFPLLEVAAAVLPALTVLGAVSAVATAALAARENDLRRFGGWVVASLSSSVLTGFGLGSPAAALAMAISAALVAVALTGVLSHLTRDLRVVSVGRLGPAWRHARPATTVLLGCLVAAAGLIGTGGFFGRAAILTAAISGPGHALPQLGSWERVVGGGGLVLAAALLALGCGRVAAFALKGGDPTDPREAREARRHLTQARPGGQLTVLRAGLVVALLSGLVSLPGIHWGVGAMLALEPGRTALAVSALSLSIVLLLPLAAAGAGFALAPVSGAGSADPSWLPWLDGTALFESAEELVAGWPGRALVALSNRVLEPLFDSAGAALDDAVGWEPTNARGWLRPGLGSSAAALVVVAIAVGVAVWLGAFHPAAAGAP
jgi:NADH:ubiquinone oxidoreductase subunit 5 (subunit L)/multisubunit Na+/H+ antiporter MnhA subunit